MSKFRHFILNFGLLSQNLEFVISEFQIFISKFRIFNLEFRKCHQAGDTCYHFVCICFLHVKRNRYAYVSDWSSMLMIRV